MTNQHLIGIIMLAFFWFLMLEVGATTRKQRQVYSLICAGLLIAALAVLILTT